ncbi:DUF305 domain-containing protein [Nocardioides cavernae]|uniref:DUF305 domain-containing protein n=1 Tax=Nocardioides cavernae TaxID=1921566 RepID=A0ABR8NB72_9ACTN|nr:DUF305 domain-containing protein [Nocardioides cavernae]MBD3925388.1 DUF305 domain-containing protein [Nocardioides cavernae]MBM7514233.1 uncharacterized protein (DUF305 family) [Nocardioides cavernae]
MRRTIVAAVVAAALVGAGAGAAVTAHDDDGWPQPMMSEGRLVGHLGGQQGGLGGHMAGFATGHHLSAASEQEYLAEMVAHHQEAIDAARELRRSDRATMRRFGERIVEAQSAQVAQMESWLAEWYPGDSTDVDYEPMMRDLTGLTGDRLDRTFLEDMVGHHMAAVMMSQHGLASPLFDHDEVAVLAVDIRNDQHAEILRMRAWLRDWFGVRSMR